MQAIDIITEMAFPKAVLEAKIRAKEETINLHVVKILAFAVDETTKMFWRKEILAETAILADYQMRDDKKVRRVKSTEYFKMLYLEPFEHNEIKYVAGLIKMAARRAERDGRPMQRNNQSLEKIAFTVKAFHETLSVNMSVGNDGEEIVNKL